MRVRLLADDIDDIDREEVGESVLKFETPWEDKVSHVFAQPGFLQASVLKTVLQKTPFSRLLICLIGPAAVSAASKEIV